MIIHSILNEHVKILDFNPHFVSSSQQNSNHYVLYSTYCFYEITIDRSSYKVYNLNSVKHCNNTNVCIFHRKSRHHLSLVLSDMIGSSPVHNTFYNSAEGRVSNLSDICCWTTRSIEFTCFVDGCDGPSCIS